MKKLEDIPKKDLFEAPEGYFDKLPGIIQARVAKPSRELSWFSGIQTSLKYALPVVVIGIAGIFYFNKSEEQSPESLLATVDTSALVSYLEDTDVSSEDLIDGVMLDADEADAIHDSAVEEISVDEADLDNLSNEFGADYF